MNTINLHLERLKRHYETASKTYDEISFLDLSHTLRLWAELKNVLPEHYPKFRDTISFKSAMPLKKVTKVYQKTKHVFAYMPDGVITFAANGQIASKDNFDPSLPAHLVQQLCVI